MNNQCPPVLYAIVTGSPAASEVGALTDFAQADGWDVRDRVPDGSPFIDADTLEAWTRHPVRTQYKMPGIPDRFPPADGMLVAPITQDSLAGWAAGISDTLSPGLLVVAVGQRIPVVAVPFANPARRSFPTISHTITDRSEGVSQPLG
ncbi:flavoprotein [Nocardia tengchongensis]|uniref:flavoprotein n=1 Tax=Nocardia tengchongensis TaxID=2055889 RepID=UPI0036753590